MTDNITMLTENPIVTQTFGDSWLGVALAAVGVIVILVAYYYHQKRKKA